MEGVTLSPTEQRRLVILGQLDRRALTVREAATLLGRSARQTYRLRAAWLKEGAAGLAHGNRGRAPPNTLPVALKEKVRELAAGEYAGVNICHLTELLAEREGITVSRSTLRRVFIQAGLERPRTRRAPRHRSRRERYPQEGLLVQTDGSYHDWLQGRGPCLTLIGAIDDATGKVVAAHFQMEEDSPGYFLMLREMTRRYGLPAALYHDRHGVFNWNRPAQVEEDERLGIIDPSAGDHSLTQFGRLLKELGVQSVISHSPQAKGRVERLWGTFQDRLVSELRLAGACTMTEANRVLADFLPRYNGRFPIPATDPSPAWRALWPGFREQDYFYFRYQRCVGRDNVIRFGQARLQVLPGHGRASYAGCKVEVREHLDGQLTVHYQDKTVTTKPAPAETSLLRAKTAIPNPVPPPNPDHPWRQWIHRKPVLTRG